MNEIEKSRIQEIVQLHNEIGELLMGTLPRGIRIGELLTEQKADLGHGAFLPWVEDSLPFSIRTAQNYMKIFRNSRCFVNEYPIIDNPVD